MDPHGGLGCNAGGHQLCRFCGFGAYASIECPETRVEVEIRLEGTVEGFNQTAFIEHLANFLGVPAANVQLRVVPSSILVTATILVPSGASTTSVTSSSTTILERLRSLDSATASQILQVVVLSIAPPTITSTATDMNAATRAAFQEADASRRNTRIIGITAGGAAAAICVVLLICGCCRFRRRRRKGGAASIVRQFNSFTIEQRSSVASNPVFVHGALGGVGPPPQTQATGALQPPSSHESEIELQPFEQPPPYEAGRGKDELKI
jgi:hypothetical protein